MRAAQSCSFAILCVACLASLGSPESGGGVRNSTVAASSRWEPINKNTRIIDYAGELIDHKESLKRETKYLKRGEIWCFTVNRRWVRDANVGGNNARFINHACKPNCYSQIVGDTIWIRAAATSRRARS